MQNIYNTMGIEKVKLAKKWVEDFDNGLDELLKNFEEKISQIYNNKKKYLKSIDIFDLI